MAFIFIKGFIIQLNLDIKTTYGSKQIKVVFIARWCLYDDYILPGSQKTPELSMKVNPTCLSEGVVLNVGLRHMNPPTPSKFQVEPPLIKVF